MDDEDEEQRPERAILEEHRDMTAQPGRLGRLGQLGCLGRIAARVVGHAPDASAAVPAVLGLEDLAEHPCGGVKIAARTAIHNPQRVEAS